MRVIFYFVSSCNCVAKGAKRVRGKRGAGNAYVFTSLSLLQLRSRSLQSLIWLNLKARKENFILHLKETELRRKI
ncbi:hypothetical protein [Campylobacter troglodytis]|uniref:hypothetical protein n=1 Tax=Campylobacter troglodytis TaxID=654363 RepID=UPI001158F563|nr:hypothetical protein [Campylobacter troglodytis]